MMNYNRPNSMTNDYHTQEVCNSDAIAFEVEKFIAENTGNAQSMHFGIPARSGSFLSELHTLREQLQYYHYYHIEAYALMPVVKSGTGPELIVQASGLVLFVHIGNMSPEVLMCVRAKCRLNMRQLAGNKGLHNDHNDWQEFLGNNSGKLAQGTVASQVKTFTRILRGTFLSGLTLTNGAIHYRINKSGALESAFVDYAEAPARLKWELA